MPLGLPGPTEMTITFEPVPTYLPFTGGTYEVAAGLRALGTDFGNGDADRRVFQLAADWPAFHAAKRACRRERLGKYYVRHELDPAAEAVLIDWMIHRLTGEYPNWFAFDNRILRCALTGDEIAVDGESRLDRSRSALSASYVDAFDALASQVSEDICLIKAFGDRDWLAAAHVCSPGHWAPADKVGRSFAEVHAPVAGIEPINRHAGRFVRTMIDRGPFVRFAWGLGTDDRANHHPQPPVGLDEAAWRGRQFDPANPRLFVRIERQVMWGLPALGAAVFTLRVTQWNAADVQATPADRVALAAALRSMSVESLRYKGIADSVDAVVRWLQDKA